jgi:hypothetical protein
MRRRFLDHKQHVNNLVRIARASERFFRLAKQRPEGKDAFAIQGWLGHQSLNMTKGYCALAADRFKGW